MKINTTDSAITDVTCTNENNETCNNDCLLTNQDNHQIIGNISKNINIDQDIKVNQIRSDLQIETVNAIRIWGKITDQNECPVKNALVKLVLELENTENKLQYRGIADCITDYEGFYQFNVPTTHISPPATFKIFAGKQTLEHDINIKKIEYTPCATETIKSIR